MAFRRGSSLFRALQQSAFTAQVGRHQADPMPAAQLATPAFATSPAQSILRRFFAADGSQTVVHDEKDEKSKMVNEGGTEHGSYHEVQHQIKTTKSSMSEQAGNASGELQEKAKETADAAKGKAYEAKEQGADMADKVKETAQSATETAKDKASEAKDQGAGVVDKVKDQAGKEMNTAGDMVKDVPEKTKETAEGLKEVGIEAAKAIKRDAEKLAEKVGLKSPQ